MENGSCYVENGSGKWKMEVGKWKSETRSGMGPIRHCTINIAMATHDLFPLATPIDCTHSPLLSSILLFKVWMMTILESGWNRWVWLVDVVSRRWVWLVVEPIGVHVIALYSTIPNSYKYK